MKKANLSEIMKIDTVVGGYKVAINAYERLTMSDDLNTDMDSVVKGFHYTGVLAAMAEEEMENMKIELEELRGYLDNEARDSNLNFKITESTVAAYISQDERYVQKRRELNERRTIYKSLKSLNRAYEMKSELLRTKAANDRKLYDDLGTSK